MTALGMVPFHFAEILRAAGWEGGPSCHLCSAPSAVPSPNYFSSSVFILQFLDTVFRLRFLTTAYLLGPAQVTLMRRLVRKKDCFVTHAVEGVG